MRSRYALPRAARLLSHAVALTLTIGACAGDAERASAPQWSEQYQRALHPYVLFLDVDRRGPEENRLIAACMRARGWANFPLQEASTGGVGADGRVQLSTLQSVEERQRVAQNYGEQLLSPPPRSSQRAANDRFADWLAAQPGQTRAKYLADFSGHRADNEPPSADSCKGEALAQMRSHIPSAVVAVEARAGELYKKYVTSSDERRRGERAWRECMRQRGFPEVGSPLSVWNPRLQEDEEMATLRLGTVSSQRRAELARLLTEQALAEHDCAVKHLDAANRQGELKAVQELVEEFPEYRRLVA